MCLLGFSEMSSTKNQQVRQPPEDESSIDDPEEIMDDQLNLISEMGFSSNLKG